MRRLLLAGLSTVALAACGADDGPPASTSRTLAPAYRGVVVARVLPDGIGVTGLDPYPLELFELQSAGGRVVGKVRRPDRGPSYEVRGTFDATTGLFRLDAFEATLTSTRTEVVEALGGRADDDDGDGVADTIAGFANTSSTARFATDGDLLAGRVADDLPSLDPGKLTVEEIELGTVVLDSAPGFASGPGGVEVIVHSTITEQPTFRLTQASAEGQLTRTDVPGISGDVIVLRMLRGRQRGLPIWVRVP